ncbi:unnamed protein product [Blepharisma stoltei]|uniref:Uncharacterized protein n=1 Tax=Blepharisma stoltei TaxID=1481888 RepID=A0AAU9JZ16_9CILI|nr:unnamed protein product [Blepharisma stoltei]
MVNLMEKFFFPGKILEKNPMGFFFQAYLKKPKWFFGTYFPWKNPLFLKMIYQKLSIINKEISAEIYK